MWVAHTTISSNHMLVIGKIMESIRENIKHSSNRPKKKQKQKQNKKKTKDKIMIWKDNDNNLRKPNTKKQILETNS